MDHNNKSRNTLFNRLLETMRFPWTIDKDVNREFTSGLTYFEVLAFSWIFHFILGFYQILTTKLGIITYQKALDDGAFSKILFSQFELSWQKLSLFIGLTEIVIYPIFFIFIYAFFKKMIEFFDLFLNFHFTEIESNNRKILIEKLLASFFLSSILFIIPIIGGVLCTIYQIIICFLVLYRKLNYTKIQAIFILFSPVIVCGLWILLIISYFAFLISLIF